jgi:uncharacterized RDD family membrane protein YckC
MDWIQIETTQNVTIEYNIGSIGDRIIAVLIDSLILIGYTVSVVVIVSTLRLKIGIAGVVILYIPVFFYDLLCETFLNGQSFGKKIRKIKVVKLDGSQPNFLSYFLRWILRPIDIWFTYGSVALITILINGKGQRLGDLAANTTIIKLKNEATLDDTILMKVKEDYIPKFPEVSALSDKDIGVIKEVLERVSKIDDPIVFNRIVTKCKNVFLEKLGITTDLGPLTFLQTILRDYSYINNSINNQIFQKKQLVNQ